MLLQNLRQIIRGLFRYKGFSIINLLGLSIGIAATVIIFLISGYENSFDAFHSNTRGIYRVVRKETVGNVEQNQAAVPYPLARMLRNEYAGVRATEIHYQRDVDVRIGNAPPFAEKNMVFADSLFFSVFDYSGIKNFVVTGDVNRALSTPGKAILTQSIAKKYFGTSNPIGQLLKVNNKVDVEVMAVVKDMPPNTHIPANIIVSFATLNADLLAGLNPDNWDFVSNGYCYVRLDNTASTGPAERSLAVLVKRNNAGKTEKKQVYSLQPLGQIHFDPLFKDSNPSYTVSKKYLTMLLLLGGFIMLIACVNYINLSTSLAFTKSKEIGIRKTIGASKVQLFFHYILETVLVTTIAAAIGLAIAILLLPYVNQMLDKSVPASQMLKLSFLAGIAGGILLVSLISGIYPALVLVGFNPVSALKNRFVLPGKSSALLRQGLVVFQFTTSIALIICTIVIARQMSYFRNKELGFNKEAVIEVGLPESDSTRIEGLRLALQNDPAIRSLSFCLGAPISDNGFNTTLKAPELDAKSEYSIQLIPCDGNYLETYQLKLAAGRWFLPEEERNKGSAIVVNEAMMRLLGYKTATELVGKKIRTGLNGYTPMIIGVTKDFHVSSFHDAIQPVGLLPFPYFYYAAAIRIQPQNTRAVLARIESAWRKVYPESVYSMKFMDETLAERYAEETRDFQLFEAFSVISIFICCIGLWGLIAFVVVRKTKEIGIRKVLGASVTSIVALLSKDFLKLVLLGLVVASPLAWYFMSKWLENFAYRVDLSWWVFAAAGLSALIIALLTISFQTIRAAMTNPVRNMRNE